MVPCEEETNKMDDIDAMFSDLLGEMDNLSQSLTSAAKEETPTTRGEKTISIGFKDLKESLNELEDQDLDALVADLGSKAAPSQVERPPADERPDGAAAHQTAPPALDSAVVAAAAHRPPPPPSHAAESPTGPQTGEAQTKADKIRMALERLKEAKVRKLIVKVLMSDNSSRTVMVDETQTVREVLDKMFEKTHCDPEVAWALCERNPELQTERGFEDHECLVETLCNWARNTENKLYFVSRPQRYTMFTHPQLFYMWKKRRMEGSSEFSEQAKELLIKEHFGGAALIVPDVEGTLHLKEDGKKVWKPRYFVLRASGIYYVPKGKTKLSSDLACFVRFENVDIYTTRNYKHKYRAPTNCCFILKHPCIQKESHYIKFLCCDNEEALLLWLTSIRIAKYGTVLYKNYQAAMKRNQPAVYKDDSVSPVRAVGLKSAELPPSSTGEVKEYPYEPPPDFIPPPPRHAEV